MTVERYLRLIAGFFVMLSVALGYWVNPAWFCFTAFVGLNPSGANERSVWASARRLTHS